jgi:hypothetical protein
MGRTLLAPISYGLGDLVVSLPAVQALINERSPVWLVARSASQRLLAQRIAGLAGVIDEATLSCGRDDQLIDLRDHPLQRDYWWGSPAFEAELGPLNINDILERICVDFGITADFTAPVPLDARPRRELGRTVLLVHETDGADKQWPLEHWTRLVARLESDRHQVAHVARAAGPSWPDPEDAVPALVLPTPDAAIDALSGCRAVVGVDTGLTHIAVQQGTPTVAICRRNSVYVRPWPHCSALRGGDCTDACVAAEAAYAYNQTVSLRAFRPRARGCPSGSPCLAATGPDEAAALLRGLL